MLKIHRCSKSAPTVISYNVDWAHVKRIPGLYRSINEGKRVVSLGDGVVFGVTRNGDHLETFLDEVRDDYRYEQLPNAKLCVEWRDE